MPTGLEESLLTSREQDEAKEAINLESGLGSNSSQISVSSGFFSSLRQATTSLRQNTRIKKCVGAVGMFAAFASIASVSCAVAYIPKQQSENGENHLDLSNPLNGFWLYGSMTLCVLSILSVAWSYRPFGIESDIPGEIPPELLQQVMLAAKLVELPVQPIDSRRSLLAVSDQILERVGNENNYEPPQLR